jgi:hypothetical protein
MRTICFTSDKRAWAMPAFAHQWDKYTASASNFSALPFEFAGYTNPGVRMTLGHTFHSIGDFADYPFEKWSDGIIKFLSSIHDDLILWMMEDFWLLRQADDKAIYKLEEYMLQHLDIARMDLSSDRASNKDILDIGYLGHLDLVESTPDIVYHFSFQAGIWRRKMLLDCMTIGETPWEAEINGNARLIEYGYRVLGTRQRPLRYLIAVQQGKVTLDGGYQGKAFGLCGQDRDDLEEWGYLHA